ncbi:Ferrochelatase-2 chloroplastic [Bienertia sinuspersici]
MEATTTTSAVKKYSPPSGSFMSSSQSSAYMPCCRYTCRLSSSPSFTILSSSSNNQTSNLNGFSYCCQPLKKSDYCCQPLKRSDRVGKAFCSTAINPTIHEDEDLALAPSLIEEGEEKIGVLLLNLGGPETLNDVQPFLFNLFADPDIIRLPMLFRFLQKPLAQLISMLRASKSKEGYASIGGANAIKLALQAKNKNVSVYVGMRYWYPFTEEAVQQIKKDKVTKLVVLPLYPQFSISTTGSSLRVLQTMFRKDAYLSRLPCAIIRSWYQREGYVKSMADLIEKELHAHGVPVSYVEDAGDPYKDQMEDCIFLIMKELKARGITNSHTLAYQSRVGPVQWLKPYTDEVLMELGQKGVKSLLAVPVSFVSEHIETLEEIDMEYKDLALESGIENWGRVPALNCSSPFINDLADAVLEALPSASAMSTITSEGADNDPIKYLIKLFFGSLLAFVLLLSPKMISAFRSNLL